MIPLHTPTPGGRRSGAALAVIPACLVAVALVGYIDAITTAYVAFSIFYLPAIILATWFEGARWGVVVGVAAATAGLIADLWTFHAVGATGFAFVNFGLRLLLFTLVSLAVARLRDSARRERELSDLAKETAARLAAVNEIKDELMRAVVNDVRGPLGDIYATAITLQRATPSDLSADEMKERVAQIAGASKLMSDLVNRLMEAERLDVPRPTHLSSVG